MISYLDVYFAFNFSTCMFNWWAQQLTLMESTFAEICFFSMPVCWYLIINLRYLRGYGYFVLGNVPGAGCHGHLHLIKWTHEKYKFILIEFWPFFSKRRQWQSLISFTNRTLQLIIHLNNSNKIQYIHHFLLKFNNLLRFTL